LKRSNAEFKTEIERIQGNWQARSADRLLKHFKSVKKIKEASIEDLEKIVERGRPK